MHVCGVHVCVFAQAHGACVEIRKPLSSIDFPFLSCGIWGIGGAWVSRRGSKNLYLLGCLTSPAVWFFLAVQYSEGIGELMGLDLYFVMRT